MLRLPRARRNVDFDELFWQAAKFLVVGAANTLVALGTIIFTINFFGFGDVAANLSGYTIGLTLGFILNRHWTFQAIDRRSISLVIGYLAAFAVSYALNLIVVLVVLETGTDHLLAQVCGIPAYTGAFFLLCRFVVFRHVRNAS